MDLVKFIKGQNESLTNLIDLIPIPIFYKDRKGVYLGCNKAFEGFVNLSKEEFIGKTVYELFSKEKATLYFQKDEELFTNPGIQVYDGKVDSDEDAPYNVRFHKATFKDDKGEITGLIGAIFDITKEVKQEKYLKKLASYDGLTGLYNRRKGILLLEKQINQSKYDNFPFSVVMADIDNFKKINDTYGHNYGDDILRAISQVLKNNLRDQDVIFRHGGEEFIYFLPKMNREQAFFISEKIRKSILKYFENHDKNKCNPITASFGISTYPIDGDDVDQLINKADSAMYKIKINGRNGVGFTKIT